MRVIASLMFPETSTIAHNFEYPVNKGFIIPIRHICCCHLPSFGILG